MLEFSANDARFFLYPFAVFLVQNISVYPVFPDCSTPFAPARNADYGPTVIRSLYLRKEKKTRYLNHRNYSIET